MSVRKLGLKILGTVLLNGNNKMLRELQKEVKILEAKISKKSNALVKLNGKLLSAKLSYKGLSRKISCIKKMKSKTSIVEKLIPNANGINGIEKIKDKYPNLPKTEIERIEIERTIARYLMGMNSGAFYTSQILKTLEDLYSIESDDRIMLLAEIKSWIERDPLCRVVKTIDNVQHYTFI